MENVRSLSLDQKASYVEALKQEEASLFLAYAYVDSALYWFMLLLRRFSRVGLCDPRDGSPLGFSIPGILQARILEWVAISFCNA